MQQDCPNYLRKVRKTKLLPLALVRTEKKISEQALHWALNSSVYFAEMIGERAFLHCMSVFVWANEHFNENKAFHHKQTQFNRCFLSLFYFLSIISSFVANLMSFIEALSKLRICLFPYVFCRREYSKTWYCGTVLALLLPRVASLSHIYRRQIARSHFWVTEDV